MAKKSAKPKQDQAILEEIRSNFDSAVKFWDPIHKHGNRCVQFLAGDPWDPRDVEAREKDEQKRPHLVFDEASQYINSLCGKERQRKRSIQAAPESGKANKETAEKIQARLYYIENKSKAQSKYISAFKDAASRGYGFLGASKCYSNSTGREQEPTIRGFDNPDSVLFQPYTKEYDGSDARWVFVMDRIGKGEFKRVYKRYEPSDISEHDDSVIVTEYWKLDVAIIDRTLYLRGPAGETEVKESELEGGEYDEARDGELIDERDIEKKTVTKYICQLVASGRPETSEGVEILAVEKTKWKSIPIVPIFGEKYYVSDGNGVGGSPKIVYLSLISRALDAMGLLNLSFTNAAEQLAMVPKTRYLGYVGQFETDRESFKNVGTSPVGMLEVDPEVDAASGHILPLPRKENWEPAIQATMMLIERLQDSIRSAVGQIASPELDKNKSGIAIKRLTDSGDTASFHLPDNFAMSLERLGCLLGEALHDTHDNDRMVPIRTGKGATEMVRINAPHQDKTGKQVHYDFTAADYGYTITTGPSHQSQADATREYVTNLVTAVPELVKSFGDIYTEAQNLGPDAEPIIARFKKLAGDLAAEDGAAPNPEQLVAELKKGQQMVDLLTKALQEAQQKIETKQIERETQLELQRMKDENNIKVEEIKQADKMDLASLAAQVEALLLDRKLAHEATQAATAAATIPASQQAQQEHQAGMQDQQLTVQQQESEAARQAAAQEQPAAQ